VWTIFLCVDAKVVQAKGAVAGTRHSVMNKSSLGSRWDHLSPFLPVSLVVTIPTPPIFDHVPKNESVLLVVPASAAIQQLSPFGNCYRAVGIGMVLPPHRATRRSLCEPPCLRSTDIRPDCNRRLYSSLLCSLLRSFCFYEIARVGGQAPAGR
jgi:hypothetical protein